MNTSAALPQKHRFSVLDIFRGLFAFFVFLYHLRPFADTLIINNKFVDNCDLFVDFFFVLSGFVIALNYLGLNSGPDLLRFLKKRFLRIYPLHLCLLFIFLGIELTKQYVAGHVQVNNANNIYNTPESFLSSLLLLNSTDIMVHGVCWNIPSWSISAEMIAYLLFAVTLFFKMKIPAKLSFLTLSLVIVVVLVVLMRLLTGGFLLDYTFDFGYLRGIIGFFTGVACYYAYQHFQLHLRSVKAIYFDIAESLLIALLVVMVYYGAFFKVYGLTFELLFFCNVFLFAFEKGLISRLLGRQAFLHNLGKYSYSVYLTHALMISLFNVLFIRILKLEPSAYAWLFVLNFAITYWVSKWTYKHIEMKFYHIKIRKST
jgi:peptidoglycan/LPS O-acetylase OafA/YrhL